MKKLLFLLVPVLLSGCFALKTYRPVSIGMPGRLLPECGRIELAGETAGEEGMIRSYWVTSEFYLYLVTTYQGSVIDYSRTRKPIYRSRGFIHHRAR